MLWKNRHILHSSTISSHSQSLTYHNSLLYPLFQPLHTMDMQFDDANTPITHALNQLII